MYENALVQNPATCYERKERNGSKQTIEIATQMDHSGSQPGAHAARFAAGGLEEHHLHPIRPYVHPHGHSCRLVLAADSCSHLGHPGFFLSLCCPPRWQRRVGRLISWVKKAAPNSHWG